MFLVAKGLTTVWTSFSVSFRVQDWKREELQGDDVQDEKRDYLPKMERQFSTQTQVRLCLLTPCSPVILRMILPLLNQSRIREHTSRERSLSTPVWSTSVIHGTKAENGCFPLTLVYIFFWETQNTAGCVV